MRRSVEWVFGSSGSRRRKIKVVAVAAGLLSGLMSAVSPSAASDAVESRPVGRLVFGAHLDAIRDAGAVGVIGQMRGTDAGSVAARSGTAVRGVPVPVPWGSHTRIGSITKTFVSTVILQLVDEGRLSLDDSVEDWLPGLIQGNGNDGSRITVRNLLQHTSGLFDYILDDRIYSRLLTKQGFEANRFRQYTMRRLAAIAVSHPPDFEPGARFGYSNTNYIVAGLLIEAVTGRHWSVEVRERIIEPLRLDQTSMPGSDPTLPWPSPRGYELFDTNREYTDVTEHNMSWGASAGEMISTPADKNTFYQALLTGRLLSPSSLAQMKTLVDVGGGQGYGLGLVKLPLSCGPAWGHTGGVIGFLSFSFALEDGSRSVSFEITTSTNADLAYAQAVTVAALATLEYALCGAAVTDALAEPTATASLLLDPLADPSARESLAMSS